MSIIYAPFSFLYSIYSVAKYLVNSGAVDLIVVDSVAALTPKAEIEGEMGDSHMGLHARLMSQALRMLAGICNKTNCSMIFINQLRDKIGVMFGNPETTTGGKALKFYASIRMDVRKVDQIKDGAEIVGNRTKVKVVKNKLAPPFKTAEFDIMYGKGISATGCIFDLAVEHGFIQKSGTWFSIGDDKIGQGKENARRYIEANPTLMAELDEKIREEVRRKTTEKI